MGDLYLFYLVWELTLAQNIHAIYVLHRDQIIYVNFQMLAKKFKIILIVVDGGTDKMKSIDIIFSAYTHI